MLTSCLLGFIVSYRLKIGRNYLFTCLFLWTNFYMNEEHESITSIVNEYFYQLTISITLNRSIRMYNEKQKLIDSRSADWIERYEQSLDLLNTLNECQSNFDYDDWSKGLMAWCYDHNGSVLDSDWFRKEKWLQSKSLFSTLCFCFQIDLHSWYISFVNKDRKSVV